MKLTTIAVTVAVLLLILHASSFTAIEFKPTNATSPPKNALTPESDNIIEAPGFWYLRCNNWIWDNAYQGACPCNNHKGNMYINSTCAATLIEKCKDVGACAYQWMYYSKLGGWWSDELGDGSADNGTVDS